jgi:serine/threonine-protein kinase/endoribonuclease IRE1
MIRFFFCFSCRWMALDARTGLRFDLPSETSDVSTAEEETCPYESGSRVLIGRSEYTIAMMDSKKRSKAHAGRTSWNVTYHDYAAMDLPEDEDYEYFHFASSSGGRLLSVQRSTGRILHQRVLGEHPIVAVYSLRQDGLFRIPFTTVAPETLDGFGKDLVKKKSDLFQVNVTH